MNKSNDNNIFFPLCNNEKIIIELGESIDTIGPCDEVLIKFYHNNNESLLANDCLLYLLREFKDMLQDALNNELSLHSSINKNIGYIWNQELHGESGLIYNQYQGQTFWIGEKYLLWSTPGNVDPILSTWLYNDSTGNIIFEITPIYKWHFNKPKKNEFFIPYKNFMQIYTPLFVRTLSKDSANTWYMQVEKLLKMKTITA